jgi:hypothetical protein
MKIFTLICLILISVSTLSAEYTRSNVTVVKIHPLSKDRVHDSGLAGYTRIYVNQAAWGGSSCRADAADLKNGDSHLLSILLAAWVSGKKIDILVDDSLPKAQSSVCRITGLFVS